jgi:hypothetical protein
VSIDFAGPKIVFGSAGQVILLTDRCCARWVPNATSPELDGLWMIMSSDGGQSFAPPKLIGDNPPSGEAIFGPGAFGVSTITDVVTGATNFQSQPLDSYTSAKANVGDNGPGQPTSEYDGSIGLIDQQTPIIADSTIPGGGGARHVYFRAWGGGSGDYNNLALWKPSVDVGAGAEARLASGPRGVYLLYKTGEPGASTYVVRRFSGSTFGSPTAVSETGDPIFRDFYEDQAGGLNAAWVSTDRGLQYRSSADGVTWTAPQTLVTQTQDDKLFHIDIGACAPGNGFAVWDQNTDHGVIHGAALGDNTRCASPQSSTCPTEVSFGVVQALTRGGCFTRSGSTYTASGQVSMNGLQIAPSGGSKLAIDSATHTLTTTGVVTVTAGSLTLGKQKLDWFLPPNGGSIEAGDGSGNPSGLDIAAAGGQVLGFKADGKVFPKLVQQAAQLPLNLQVPSPVGGLVGGPLTDDVTLRTDSASVGGLNLSPGNVHIHLDDAWLGIAELKPFDLSYTADPAVLDGNVTLKLPVVGSDIKTHFKFQQGAFVDASADLAFPSPGIPVAGTVYLSSVNFHAHKLTDCAHPTSIGGGVGLTGGPRVGSLALLGIKGDLSYSFPETTCQLPGVFRAEGTGSLVSLPVASVFAQYKTSGQLTFGANFGLDLSVISASASIDGGIDIPTKSFYAEGKASATLIGIGKFANADLLVSNVGLGACAEITPLGGVPVIGGLLDGGFEYHWGGSVSVHYPGCDVSDLKPVVFQHGARAQADAAGFRLNRGLPFAVVTVDGNGAPPAVTLTGPRGQKVTTPTSPMQIRTRSYAVAMMPAMHRTAIEVFKPAGGSWSLSAQPGSAAITSVTTADGLPQPQVAAHVSPGQGRRRVLTYRIRRIPGQTVRFIEQGPATYHLIGITRRRRGSFTFVPADGRGGRRTIVAVVDQGGFPRRRLRLSSYSAPPPFIPGAPKSLSVRRSRGGLAVSWGRSAGAKRFLVRVLLSDGRRLEFVLKRRSLRVQHVPGIDYGTIIVVGLRGDNQPGHVARARLRPQPAKACSKRKKLPRCKRRHRR